MFISFSRYLLSVQYEPSTWGYRTENKARAFVPKELTAEWKRPIFNKKVYVRSVISIVESVVKTREGKVIRTRGRMRWGLPRESDFSGSKVVTSPFALCLDSTSVQGLIEIKQRLSLLKMNLLGYFSLSLFPVVLDYWDHETTKHPKIDYFLTSCLQSLSNSFGKC